MIVISAGLAYFLSLPFVAVLQGGNYRVKTLSRAKRWIIICLFYFFLCGGISLLLSFFCGKIPLKILTLFLCGATGCFVALIHHAMKIRLTFTNRVARLLICSTLLYAFLFVWLGFTSFYALSAATPALVPFTLALSAGIVNPLERKNNARYLKKTQLKLNATSAIKIGVTGSYGKTSVKVALETLLSKRFATLVTPSNYNTPLGVAKTMEGASGKEEILVIEMGARREGEIRELCELVSPTIGVITGIAPQHLETFGSLDAIRAEKGELAKSIPEEGTVYYNLTDPEVQALYDARSGKKVGVGFEAAEYLISDLEITARGSVFRLQKEAEECEVHIPAIGIAAIVNFSLAAAVAHDLGMSLSEIAAVGERFYPASHRFEIVRSGDVTVIDDSYNINPVGANAALQSLSHFAAERRIVYTSGMVELGKEEASLNRALGKSIARCASYAIVCAGRYGDLVAEGIREENPDLPILRVKDTAEASARFKTLLRKGDVLLIMSDLPRDYLL